MSDLQQKKTSFAGRRSPAARRSPGNMARRNSGIGKGNYKPSQAYTPILEEKKVDPRPQTEHKMRGLDDRITEEESDNDPMEFSAENRGKMTERTQMSLESPDQRMIPAVESIKVDTYQSIQVATEDGSNVEFQPSYVAIDSISRSKKKVPELRDLSPLKVKCSDFKAEGTNPTPTVPRLPSPRKISPRKSPTKIVPAAIGYSAVPSENENEKKMKEGQINQIKEEPEQKTQPKFSFNGRKSPTKQNETRRSSYRATNAKPK